MKTSLIVIALLFSLIGTAQQTPELVAQFKGQQVTGVSISTMGRIFANFPRWRESVRYSVVEVATNGDSLPFPGEKWNSWHPGMAVSDSMFVAVQSLVASVDKLYVLDTRNPLRNGVVDNPRIFVFDLTTNQLVDIFILSNGSFQLNSYTNDLCIDNKNGYIYITDSNQAGLIAYNMHSRKSTRFLNDHYSTTGEFNSLSINGLKWGGRPVHSDGIAYNRLTDRLYYHALTGYTLYSVSAYALRKGDEKKVEKSIKNEGKTPAPDGMIFDKDGNLYMANLEKNAIVRISTEGKTETLCQGEKVGWADTFSIYKGWLYFTDSKIHQAKGQADSLIYTINRIALK